MFTVNSGRPDLAFPIKHYHPIPNDRKLGRFPDPGCIGLHFAPGRLTSVAWIKEESAIAGAGFETAKGGVLSRPSESTRSRPHPGYGRQTDANSPVRSNAVPLAPAAARAATMNSGSTTIFRDLPDANQATGKRLPNLAHPRHGRAAKGRRASLAYSLARCRWHHMYGRRSH